VSLSGSDLLDVNTTALASDIVAAEKGPPPLLRFFSGMGFGVQRTQVRPVT
jgi:hypothetical protein